MHDSIAQLIGAREAAHRMLYNESGIPRSWPTEAAHHRNALMDLLLAVDEVLHVERYLVNPDAPDEGYDLRATLIDDPSSLVCDPSLSAAEYHRRYTARFASR